MSDDSLLPFVPLAAAQQDPGRAGKTIWSSTSFHDLSNLLHVVLATSEDALSTQPEDRTLRGVLTLCHTAARRAGELARRLQAETLGESFPVPTAASIVALLRETCDLARCTTPSHVRWIQDLPGREIELALDATWLHRAAFNLVRNASEALGGSPGTIRVVLRPIVGEDDRAVGFDLWVEDNGHGMSGEVLAAARERGFSTRGPGRGLGLVGVEAFAQAHGGSLELESRPGLGTRVHLAVRLDRRHAPVR